MRLVREHGFFLKCKFAPIGLLDDLLSGPSLEIWPKVKPNWAGLRKEYNQPSCAEWCESFTRDGPPNGTVEPEEGAEKAPIPGDLAMTFKPTVWYPIAAVLGVVNLVAVAFAVGPVQPWHATIHAALAVAFGLWAQRLRQRREENAREAQLEPPEGVEDLEAEVDMLRQELSEMQERVDFAERMLAQRTESRPMDPQS